ncbi:alcohol dehydrogenase iron-dependent [Blautia sp. CAG:237]|uniref:alcohol dehydrogenase n=1 Tax=Blautia sp. CAG:237 TaxID=1262755 RepID=UPI0003359854|nr:alcohol dehydrogenase [Blautia sp. CAG:237]CDB76387.1 alcohol dehydrogenase iron-dependent [Blautia sp. CAG:237]
MKRAKHKRNASTAIVFDIPCGLDFEKTARAGIEAMEDFFRSIKMPVSLHELGLDLDDQQIHELAFKCSYEDTRTIGVFKQLNMKDMEKIYTMAR